MTPAELDRAHEKAMSLAEAADAARRRRDVKAARRFVREAFEIERFVAINAVWHRIDPQSRMILLRSAASLAIEAGELGEARELAYRGLRISPSCLEIREELEEILEVVEKSRRRKQRWVATALMTNYFLLTFALIFYNVMTRTIEPIIGKNTINSAGIASIEFGSFEATDDPRKSIIIQAGAALIEGGASASTGAFWVSSGALGAVEGAAFSTFFWVFPE